MAQTRQKNTSKHRQRRTPPKVAAIVLCDRIITDALTGKESLVGLFKRFVVTDIERPVNPFFIFTRMIEGKGKYAVGVKLVRPSGETYLVTTNNDVDFSPDSIIDGLVIVRGLVFSEIGFHKFFVTLDGKNVGIPAVVDVVFPQDEPEKKDQAE